MLLEVIEESADRIGSAVVSPEQLKTRALEWCQSLAEGGPNALAKTKEILHRCSHLATPVADLAKASAEPRLTDECRHGLTAFFEKKPAPWGVKQNSPQSHKDHKEDTRQG